jgi:hypothetical protein
MHALLNILTVIFCFLKLAGIVEVSWWLVFMPTIASVSIFLVVFIAAFCLLALNLKMKNI